jgi:hypothetical protein
MPRSCRWCQRPASRTIAVDAPEGAPARMALCERHIAAVTQARHADPDGTAERRRQAEREAWERAFREPAPFA